MRNILISCLTSTLLLASTSVYAQGYTQNYAQGYAQPHTYNAPQAQVAQAYVPQYTPQYAAYPRVPQSNTNELRPGALAPTADEPSSDGSGLMIGGSVLLGSFYLFSALSTAGLGEACDAGAPIDELEGFSLCGDAELAFGYIPLVGPLLALGELGDSEIAVAPVQVGLVALALGQITGAALLIGGAVQASNHDDPPPIRIQPSVGPYGATMALTGQF